MAGGGGTGQPMGGTPPGMRGVNGPGGGGYEPIPNYNTGGFGQQPANNSFGGGQPMGGYGGQQSQPMQQQMQRPMQSQFGGYNQSPQMGGFGSGMGGGFGGGFNQYNPMGGGYGMGGFSPQMGGMGGFGGGYGPQMGGFGGMGQAGMQQTAQNSATATPPPPESGLNYLRSQAGQRQMGDAQPQNQYSGMNPMQGARQMLQRFGGRQGGQGIQGLMGGMQGQMPQQMQTQGGMQGQAFGALSQPGRMGGFGGQGSLQQMPNQNIPEYAQQLMGDINQMSIGRPNTDFGPAPALTLDQQYQNYLRSR
jgi:hypothetical protein